MRTVECEVLFELISTIALHGVGLHFAISTWHALAVA